MTKIYALSLLLLMSLATNAKDLTLSCTVSGNILSAPMNHPSEIKEIPPQKVDVLIIDKTDQITIDIQSSNTQLKNYFNYDPSQGPNLSTANQYYLANPFEANGISFNNEIKINRITGKIYVERSSSDKRIWETIKFSGNCATVKSANKF